VSDRLQASVVAASAVVMVIAGCGGGGDSSSSSTTAASTSTTTEAASSTVTQTGTEELSPDSTDFLGAVLAATTAGEPGVVVLEVAPDSLTRLKVGDVIIACNGEPVANPEELVDCGGDVEIGEQFTIRIVRGEKRFTLAQVASPTAFLGVEVKDASGGRGAAVVSVPSGSPAAEGGLQKGDLITALDDARVTSGDSLVEAVGTHVPGDEVTVTFTRDGEEMQASVTLVPNPGPSG
jgi:putative serine protease PepD